MKKKDGMTGWLMKCSSSCLIFMGCCLMITGFSLLLTGCTEKARKMEKKNIKVETISVGNTNLGGMKDYVGTIEEKMGSTLSFEIAGNITSIRVDEGDRVSKGQLLATINPTTVKEAHRATLTTLKQAEDAYRRFLPLHQSGTISDMKWVEIESTYSIQLKVFASTGQLYRILDVQPGTATYSGFHPGLYIFGKAKVLVK